MRTLINDGPQSVLVLFCPAAVVVVCTAHFRRGGAPTALVSVRKVSPKSYLREEQWKGRRRQGTSSGTCMRTSPLLVPFPASIVGETRPLKGSLQTH